MGNRYSPQSPPLQDKVSNQMRIGIEIPLHPDMLGLDFALSPVAGDLGFDNFLGLYYRVDLETLLRNGLTSQILWLAALGFQ